MKVKRSTRDAVQLLLSKNQSISDVAADRHLAMIAPFCTSSALFWTFTEICRGGIQSFAEHRGHQVLFILHMEYGAKAMCQDCDVFMPSKCSINCCIEAQWRLNPLM